MPMQIRRTPTPDLAPPGLAEGQLGVEMASDPPRLWVGVPTGVDPSGRRLLNPAALTETGIMRFDGSEMQYWDGSNWISIGGDPTYVDPSFLNGAVCDTLGTAQDLTVAAWSCADSTASIWLRGGPITKYVRATGFVAGTNQSGMTVTMTAQSWLHVFVAQISGTPDVFFDSDVNAANRPAGTTAFRRVWSIRLDASSNIVPFFQRGDFCYFRDAYTVLDVSTLTANIGTSYVFTNSMVPPGVITEAFIQGNLGIMVGAAVGNSATVGFIPAIIALATSGGPALGVATVEASTAGAPITTYQTRVLTDESQNARYWWFSNLGQCSLRVACVGYFDWRGRM